MIAPRWPHRSDREQRPCRDPDTTSRSTGCSAQGGPGRYQRPPGTDHERHSVQTAGTPTPRRRRSERIQSTVALPPCARPRRRNWVPEVRAGAESHRRRSSGHLWDPTTGCLLETFFASALSRVLNSRAISSAATSVAGDSSSAAAIPSTGSEHQYTVPSASAVTIR